MMNRFIFDYKNDYEDIPKTTLSVYRHVEYYYSVSHY